MSTARAERLVNLVLCLLSTRQFLSAERIRATVAGYVDTPSDEAFFRMFERDKAELRELGVPLETGRNSAFDTHDGYRIARRDYELGEIELEPDEAAAVALAARLWDSPELAGAAWGALLKLRAAGVEVDAESEAGVQPRVRAVEPAFGPLLAAVQEGRVVTFSHRRRPGAPPQHRRVEPWGVVSWRGRWYLVGHDLDRAATRCFRLSRVAADVSASGRRGAVRRPEGVELLAVVRASAELPAPATTARLWLGVGAAHGLRRAARVVESTTEGEVVELELTHLESAARWIAGYGPEVTVLDPPELRAAVTRRWEAAAGG